MTNTQVHPTAEELAGIAAGDGEFLARYHHHLASCERCREEAATIRDGLSRFTVLAKRHVPDARQRVVLTTVPKQHASRPWAWGMGLASAATLAVAVLVLVWSGNGPPPLSIDQEAFIEQQQLADSKLLKDVGAMVENPLPSLVLELSGQVEVSGGDEDFLDFVAPPVLDGAGKLQEEWRC